MNTASSISYASYLASNSDNPYHIQHVYEFTELSKRIALETIAEVVPPMIEEVSLKVIKEYLNSSLNGSLNYDIHSLATMSIKDFNAIFSSEKFSRFISDAVSEEIRKRIDEIHIDLKL